MPAEVQAVSKNERASAFQAEALKLIEDREKAAGPVTNQVAAAPAAAAAPPAAPPAPAAATPPAPVETPAAGAVEEPLIKPPAMPQGFDVLAQEKAKLRKEQAEFQARQQKHQRVLEVLERGGGALELLTAGGKTYEDAVSEMLGIKKNGGKAPAAAPEQNPVLEEIRALKAQLAEQQEQNARNRAIAMAQAAAQKAADKYKLTNAFGRSAEAANMLLEYHTNNGELPVPGNLEASFGVALEALEAKIARETETMIGSLQKAGYAVTKNAAGAVTPPKDAGRPAASVQATVAPTLNKGQVAPAMRTSPDEPKTPEQFREAALKEFERLAATSG